MRSGTQPLLIFGGSGLLGRELLRQIRATTSTESVHATFFNADLAGTDPEWPIWHRLDLRRAGAVEGLIDDLEPTVIINAAYAQGTDDLQVITAEAPGRMAAASHASGARFVQLSSDIVFPGRALEAGPSGYRETDPIGPVNDYGRAKADAEAAVAGADPDAAIVRTSLLWGAGMDGGPQTRLVRDPEMQFFTDEFRSPLRVDRLAAAVLEVADRPEISGLLHVAGAERVDRLALARALAPRVGVDPDQLRGRPAADAARASDCTLDSALARDVLAAPLPGIGADT